MQGKFHSTHAARFFSISGSMPTYTYECENGQRFDVFQSMKDDPLTVCPECGLPVKRVIGGGAGIVFKGSGFYVTDYRKDSSGGSDSGAGGDSGSSGKSSGGESGSGSSSSGSSSSSGGSSSSSSSASGGSAKE